MLSSLAEAFSARRVALCAAKSVVLWLIVVAGCGHTNASADGGADGGWSACSSPEGFHVCGGTNHCARPDTTPCVEASANAVGVCSLGSDVIGGTGPLIAANFCVGCKH